MIIGVFIRNYQMKLNEIMASEITDIPTALCLYPVSIFINDSLVFQAFLSFNQEMVVQTPCHAR